MYSFFGETQNNADNPFDNVPAYGLLNLYAGIRDKEGMWEFSVFGKNILQERQILTMGASLVSTSVQVGATGNAVSAPYRSVTTTTPREFGISAKVFFGSR